MGEGSGRGIEGSCADCRDGGDSGSGHRISSHYHHRIACSSVVGPDHTPVATVMLQADCCQWPGDSSGG
ncbi:hypothetical protein RRG08_031647 [Elysia crispata]|uniref:Uncharacterized protein n=1 Tax=Elysia crispata TaxID=231223 RepID=A0AAE1AHV2_9GAST|nr:hypothetical protein RRG08_031647 [Elysia crispata]